MAKRHLTIALFAVLIGVVGLGLVPRASAATHAATCKVVVVRRHRVRACESAGITVSPTRLAYSGGKIGIHLASAGAGTCSLKASPALWSGANPTRVACRGNYTLQVPRTDYLRQWTISFTVRNKYRQVAVVTQRLIEPANPVQTTPNWSGYVLEGDHLNGAQGTFNVPNLLATSGPSATSEWVGVDGNSNTSLIQAGVSERYDPTTNGVLIYPWWEILPSPETPIGSMTVSAGDSVTSTVTQVAGTTWGISVVDNTNGERFATEVYYAGPQTSAEWIVEAPALSGGTIQQLGDYTPNVAFTGLAAAGHGVAVDQLFIVQNGQTVSSPSPLDPNGFTVAYGPNPPAAP